MESPTNIQVHVQLRVYVPLLHPRGYAVGPTVMEGLYVSFFVAEIVPSYKYLGINIDIRGDINDHLKDKLKKAKSGIAKALKPIINAQINSIEPKFTILNAVCRSILCYGCQVWGYNKYDEVEKIERFFIKRLLHLPMNTPNYIVLGETGLLPIYMFTLTLHFNYIIKTLKVNEDRFINKICHEIMKLNIGW